MWDGWLALEPTTTTISPATNRRNIRRQWPYLTDWVRRADNGVFSDWSV
jgi:hypothetical protein